MCRIFKIHPSDFYAWLEKPLSDRAKEDQRLLKLVKESYIASGATYGSPWIHRDLREAGETCSVHRVAKIMRENKLKTQIGYKRRYVKGVKYQTLLRTYQIDILIRRSQISAGSATLLMSERTNDFCMWLRSSIYVHVVSLAGRWLNSLTVIL
jgi:transposase InsO family protein